MSRESVEKTDLPGWRAYIAELRESVDTKTAQAGSAEESQAEDNSADATSADGEHCHASNPGRGAVRDISVDKRSLLKPRVKRVDILASGRFVMEKLLIWSAYLQRLRLTVAGSAQHLPQAAEHGMEKSSWFDALSMRGWGFYFFAKLGLFWAELIDFHALANLSLAVFIFWPIASRGWARIKCVVTFPAAMALLYYDSWLPPIDRLISQASLLSKFDAAYLIELLSRFVNWPMVGTLLAAAALYWVASRWLRTSVLIFICMLFVGLMQSPLFQGARRDVTIESTNLTTDLQDILDDESQRAISFVTPAADAVPFDVIFIHVCSLSWDDVRAVGLENHPLWARFDILLTNFNSAASYSGPAAIRLMRATCGQPDHSKLYVPTAENCYLMGNLQAAGFKPELALNHDGKFDNFLDQLRQHGRLTVPALPLDGVKIAQYAFDGSPVYDDMSVLMRWQQSPERLSARRAALYYNTISLHDGNHYAGTDAQPNTLKTYGERLSRFLNNLETIIQELERSDRRAVLVMIPEHGGAVRGDKKQIAGLREIPTPAITLVPVGIKVVGGEVLRDGDSVVIDQPTSYFAVSYIIQRMLEKSPFAMHTFKPVDYTANVPLTPFVAQNEKITVMQFNKLFYSSRNGVDWENYAEFNQRAASR